MTARHQSDPGASTEAQISGSDRYHTVVIENGRSTPLVASSGPNLTGTPGRRVRPLDADESNGEAARPRVDGRSAWCTGRLSFPHHPCSYAGCTCRCHLAELDEVG